MKLLIFILLTIASISSMANITSMRSLYLTSDEVKAFLKPLVESRIKALKVEQRPTRDFHDLLNNSSDPIQGFQDSCQDLLHTIGEVKMSKLSSLTGSITSYYETFKVLEESAPILVTQADTILNKLLESKYGSHQAQGYKLAEIRNSFSESMDLVSNEVKKLDQFLNEQIKSKIDANNEASLEELFLKLSDYNEIVGNSFIPQTMSNISLVREMLLIRINIFKETTPELRDMAKIVETQYEAILEQMSDLEI